eukprot:3941967-Rhodomonas_salina.5
MREPRSARRVRSVSHFAQHVHQHDGQYRPVPHIAQHVSIYRGRDVCTAHQNARAPGIAQHAHAPRNRRQENGDCVFSSLASQWADCAPGCCRRFSPGFPSYSPGLFAPTTPPVSTEHCVPSIHNGKPRDK